MFFCYLALIETETMAQKQKINGIKETLNVRRSGGGASCVRHVTSLNSRSADPQQAASQ